MLSYATSNLNNESKADSACKSDSNHENGEHTNRNRTWKETSETKRGNNQRVAQ